MSGQSKKRPLYKQIEMEILEKVNSGYYKVGAAIPTEYELAELYGVSRVTVRQATNNLAAQGILVRNQGSGTFVSSSTSAYERTAKIMGFKEEMEAGGRKPSTEIITYEIRTADAAISELLGIAPHALIYYIVRLRKADEQPFVLETSYISVDKYPDITYQTMAVSKYDYFEKEKKLEIDYSHHTVLPVMPNQNIADFLKIGMDKPILKVLNVTYLKNGDILDYTELVFNSERYKYTTTKTR